MSGDTIFALSSARGAAGIAVYRLSGPDAGVAFAALTGRALPEPRQAVRVRIGGGEDGAYEDGLALWFPAPHSFTGEDVIELHLHGGRAVDQAVAALLSRHARPAEPGEFTRRAFVNGKLDLTEAEGLADLVAAETEAQRRQARRQLEGALSALYDDWRARLVASAAHLAAEIDFADEEVPADLFALVRGDVAALAAEIGAHLDDARRGERLRDGIHVAILGAPNAGKSTLLNRLARRDAAIVDREAGTTRDVIEVSLDLAGYPVVLADTAGLREAEGAVESEGVRRARARAADADIKLLLFDGAAWPDCDAATRALIDGDALVVVTKSDIADLPDAPAIGGVPAAAVSALTGAGVDDLIAALADAVADRFALSLAPAPTRQRHRAALETCLGALQRFGDSDAVELAAEDLRAAAAALGRITGRVDVEDILDVVFRDFCIGK